MRLPWPWKDRQPSPRASARERALLRAHVPAYRRLPPADQDALARTAARFLREKRLIGCTGFRVTERVRWTVAGHAARALRGPGMDLLPGWRTVLIYPSDYRARSVWHAGAGVTAEETEDRSGEAARDVVVLSWRDAATDGGRLILHETAHQVDLHFGLTEHLMERTSADLAPWQRALRREYNTFIKALNGERRAPLDPYAAEDPAEFFAVASEAFFETPRSLAAALPRLYNLLQTVYQRAPAADQR